MPPLDITSIIEVPDKPVNWGKLYPLISCLTHSVRKFWYKRQGNVDKSSAALFVSFLTSLYFC